MASAPPYELPSFDESRPSTPEQTTANESSSIAVRIGMQLIVDGLDHQNPIAAVSHLRRSAHDAQENELTQELLNGWSPKLDITPLNGHPSVDYAFVSLSGEDPDVAARDDILEKVRKILAAAGGPGVRARWRVSDDLDKTRRIALFCESTAEAAEGVKFFPKVLDKMNVPYTSCYQGKGQQNSNRVYIDLVRLEHAEAFAGDKPLTVQSGGRSRVMQASLTRLIQPDYPYELGWMVKGLQVTTSLRNTVKTAIEKEYKELGATVVRVRFFPYHNVLSVVVPQFSVAEHIYDDEFNPLSATGASRFLKFSEPFFIYIFNGLGGPTDSVGLDRAMQQQVRESSQVQAQMASYASAMDARMEQHEQLAKNMNTKFDGVLSTVGGLLAYTMTNDARRDNIYRRDRLEDELRQLRFAMRTASKESKPEILADIDEVKKKLDDARKEVETASAAASAAYSALMPASSIRIAPASSNTAAPPTATAAHPQPETNEQPPTRRRRTDGPGADSLDTAMDTSDDSGNKSSTPTASSSAV